MSDSILVEFGCGPDSYYPVVFGAFDPEALRGPFLAMLRYARQQCGGVTLNKVEWRSKSREGVVTVDPAKGAHARLAFESMMREGKLA
jgi:hypothetical protein